MENLVHNKFSATVNRLFKFKTSEVKYKYSNRTVKTNESIYRLNKQQVVQSFCDILRQRGA